ncbi:hypothetical protein GDO81_021926 [Engystomops pustulosus]|uniref:Uncharacterized protein n=1 Tax=Engystomops pustulosus TaxID=76066 RepID=A0AAV6ZY96_ENGPU|nr:hypothetical protein GDO81_021926 [Engystomops pustulosus]
MPHFRRHGTGAHAPGPTALSDTRSCAVRHNAAGWDSSGAAPINARARLCPRYLDVCHWSLKKKNWA